MRIAFTFFALLICQIVDAQTTTAITNAHIFTMGKAGEIESGTIVIRDGRISQVGAKLKPPTGAKIVDAKGRIVTPGFFVVGTNLGALEIESLDRTNDSATKNTKLSAAFDIQYGIDPTSIVIPPARMAGITRVLTTPGYADDEKRDLLFAGKAATLTLAKGMRPVVRSNTAMVLELGESGATRSGRARGAAMVALKSDFEDVRWYARHRNNFDLGASRPMRLAKPDLEALVPVIDRRMPLIVGVHRASDILEVLQLAKEQRLNIVLSGAEEGWMVAGEIAKAQVPVIIDTTTNLPRTFEIRAATLENAARLHSAGVVIAFTVGDSAHRLREVRYNAGNAVAHGLPYEAALAALTTNPARMFGDAKHVGSLDPGKSADLVIWSGDPFEPLSNAQEVFIAGVPQPLTSRAQDLARRYKNLDGSYPPAYTH